MKTWYFVTLLAAVVFLASSCKKDADDVMMNQGSIYGVVTDKTTGEPVQNAGVELQPKGLKAVTGTDGTFEFVGIAGGTYNLYVTKTGYADYKSNDLQVKAADKGNSVAVQLEKLPPALQVLDDNGTDISEIDFGASEGEVMRSFNIFNKSEANLEWEIIYQSDWIKLLNKQSATLKPGSTQVIVITINRDKLQEGTNSTVMHIISDNGSKQLTIKASGSAIVETLEPTGITVDAASLNGKIKRKPLSAILEYGFVYSNQPMPSVENNEGKLVVTGGANIGDFNVDATNLQKSTTYYFRAYVKAETITYYGGIKSFTTLDGSAIVETLEPTKVTADMASLNGKINSKPKSTILEYGFVYSTKPMQSVEDNEGKLVVTGGANIGAFHVDATNLQNRTIYYYRAFVKTETDTYYGDIKSFTTLVGEYVILEESNLMVQSRDLGEASWSSANAMCKTSVVGGFSDWRLPTRAELMILYNNRKYIGGFATGYYWTSEYDVDDFCECYRYYYVDFSKGVTTTATYESWDNHVRAVRTYKP